MMTPKEEGVKFRGKTCVSKGEGQGRLKERISMVVARATRKPLCPLQAPRLKWRGMTDFDYMPFSPKVNESNRAILGKGGDMVPPLMNVSGKKGWPRFDPVSLAHYLKRV